MEIALIPRPLYRRIKLVLSTMVLFVLFSSCQADNTKININSDFLTDLKIEKDILKLDQLQGRCTIRLNESKDFELLGISFPCGFVRASEKMEAQTYYYKGIGQVFVIAGPLVDKSAYTKNSGVKYKHMCSNQGQVIIVKDRKLIILNKQTVPLGYCHRLGFDEKDYFGFVHPKNQIK